MDAPAAEPTQALHSRRALFPASASLNTHATTTHFNGQSTVSLDGEAATSESYYLTHHLTIGEDGQGRVRFCRYQRPHSRLGRVWAIAPCLFRAFTFRLTVVAVQLTRGHIRADPEDPLG